MRGIHAFGAALAASLALPAYAAAQGDVELRGRMWGARPPAAYYEILRRDPGAFEFSPENGWIVRARALAGRRGVLRAALAEGGGGALGATVAAALSGGFRVPVFLAMFKNTDSAEINSIAPQSTVQNILFGTDPAPPYSLTTLYREMSNGLLEYGGTVLPWRRLSQNDTYYEDNNNGLTARMAELIAEIVALNDPTTDYGQFDNDGPDGVPNSGDDDGFVDGIVIFHPEVDGACRTSNIWAHRYSYRAWTGTDLQTQDNAAGGGKIKIRDYIIQGGQGGSNGCTAGAPPAIGLVAHESGHFFGLPDLYNTGGGASQGIGNWGLMGTGNWNRPDSPAHLSAWSKAQLGWVTEVLLTRDTAVAISPIVTADTSYVIPIAGSNEYFLLSNRQALGSDVHVAGGGGLLIWHIDSTLARQRSAGNTVNAASPEAVRLIQADGLGQLQSGGNRGDGGDPYPGSTGNTTFGVNSTPASKRNNGASSFVEVRNIAQLAPGGAMSVELRFLVPTLIAATDTLAAFRLDGVTYRRFVGLLDDGRSYTLEMDSVQTALNGDNRYTFLSWSNAKPRAHAFTASSRGDTIIASVKTEHWLQVSLSGTGGTVTADSGDVLAGVYRLKGDTARLYATLTQQGAVFEGWSGTVAGTKDTLVLPMTRAHRLTATFAPPLAVAPGAPPQAVMGRRYSYSFEAQGGIGSYVWQRVSGDVPPGLQLSSTGTLSGTPSGAGTFNFSVRVTSGSQSTTVPVTVTVVMPVLALDSVLAHVLGVSRPLSGDELAFLDLVGNRNGRADVGDFVAWIRATNQSVSAAATAALVAKEERP